MPNCVLKGLERCVNHSSKSLITYSRARKIRCTLVMCPHCPPKIALSRTKTSAPTVFQILKLDFPCWKVINNKTHDETISCSSESLNEHKLQGAQRSTEAALVSIDFSVSKNQIFAFLKKSWWSLYNFKYVNSTNLLNKIKTKRHHAVKTSLGIWTTIIKA